jgi:RNA polymerase sigma-70 factor, ECF subfamily
MDMSDPIVKDDFYRRHSERVLRWVIRIGGPYLDAEDIAQDVFIVAFRRLSGFDPARGTEEAWLYGVTRRVVANARRRSLFRRFIGLDTLAPVPDPGPDVDAIMDTLWRRRQVQLALEQLDMSKREVLVLMDLEDHTAPETAVMLGIPVGTVYSRLHHARKAFKRALAPRADELRASLRGLSEEAT